MVGPRPEVKSFKTWVIEPLTARCPLTIPRDFRFPDHALARLQSIDSDYDLMPPFIRISVNASIHATTRASISISPSVNTSRNTVTRFKFTITAGITGSMAFYFWVVLRGCLNWAVFSSAGRQFGGFCMIVPCINV